MAPVAFVQRRKGTRVPGKCACRKDIVAADIVVDAEADLLEIISTLDAASRLACGLDGGQKQSDQHGDDRDHHEQLDQRKATFHFKLPATDGSRSNTVGLSFIS